MRAAEHSDRGSIPLEFSYIAVLLLTLLFLGPQVGLWFHARQAASHAAQEAVTVERAYDAAPGDGVRAGEEFLGDIGSLQNPQVTTSDSGSTVIVEVSGTVPTLIPGVEWTVKQQARGPREEWTTP